MSQYENLYGARAGGTAAGGSATDVARDEAANVGQHAREAGGQVAQTAAEQARQVAAESGRQARGLLAEAQGQARDQAAAQKQKATQRLHDVADELGQLAANGGQSGMATEFARQAASRLHNAASWLDAREPAQLLEEARNFARRRPGAFLLGAAVAGLAAGRLTRGLAASSDEITDGNGAAGNTRQPATAAGAGYPAVPTQASYPAATDPAVYPAATDPVGYPAATDPVDVTDPAVPPYRPGPGTSSRPEGTGW
jgi:hypothetical protein